MTPEQRQVFRWEREIDERNRPLTDDELDAIMPKDGYKVVTLNRSLNTLRISFKSILTLFVGDLLLQVNTT